jgi:hypothetical protein
VEWELGPDALCSAERPHRTAPTGSNNQVMPKTTGSSVVTLHRCAMRLPAGMTELIERKQIRRIVHPFAPKATGKANCGS